MEMVLQNFAIPDHFPGINPIFIVLSEQDLV